jgi:hypothetical protein
VKSANATYLNSTTLDNGINPMSEGLERRKAKQTLEEKKNVVNKAKPQQYLLLNKLPGLIFVFSHFNDDAKSVRMNIRGTAVRLGLTQLKVRGTTALFRWSRTGSANFLCSS